MEVDRELIERRLADIKASLEDERVFHIIEESLNDLDEFIGEVMTYLDRGNDQNPEEGA
ncbi:hypothetical protein JCM16138_14500 [Thermococcus atlanticus]